MTEKIERYYRSVRLAMIAVHILGLASAIPSTLFIYAMVSSNGTSVIDLLLTGFLGGGLMVAIIAIHHWGLNVIAQAEPARRKKLSMIFWPVAFCLALTSIGTGVGYVAYPRAEAAYHGGLLEQVDADLARVGGALSKTQAVEAVLLDARANALTLLRDELRVGAVCQNGGGEGPCASVLKALAVSSEVGASALAQAQAQAKIHQRDAADARAEIGRIVGSARLSETLKIAAIEEGVDAISAHLSAFMAAVPVQAVETALLTFSRPVDQLGLTPAGAARIKAEMESYRRQLSSALAAIKRDLAEPVVTLESKTEIQMVVDEFESVAFGVFVLMALDAVPLLLIAMFVADAPAGRDSGHGGGSGRAHRTHNHHTNRRT